MDQLFQSLPLIPAGLRFLFYGLGGLAILLFLAGTLERVSIWQLGVDRTGDAVHGLGTFGLMCLGIIKLFSRECLMARRVFSRSWARGVMVVLMIWGTLALVAGVFLSALDYLLPWPLAGDWVGWLAAPLLDLAGGLILLGLLIALGRRYVFRPERWVSVTADGVVLNLMFLIVLLAFIMEGMRLANAITQAATVLRWPVGTVFGLALARLGVANATEVSRFYLAVYLVHGFLGIALLAYLPYSKLFHLFAAQIVTSAACDEKRKFKRQVCERDVA